jgi:flagellar biosynthesis protein FliQ
MMEKLRRDSYSVGILLGIVNPAVLFGIIYGIFALIVRANAQMLDNNPNLTKILIPKFILLAMIPSLFILRYYLLKLKFDKTGRGIIGATLAWAVVFLAAQFLL